MTMLAITTTGWRTRRLLLWKGFSHRRNKITVTKTDASDKCSVHRPTPIFLLRTEHDDTLARAWQQKLSDAGYSSVSAHLELPSTEDPLTTSYQELKSVTSELSFFPPLMVSVGRLSWHISYKYVCNRPVSGLVMVDDGKTVPHDILKAYPVHEFEPHFPLLMMSKQKAPAFLDGWIDQVESSEFKQMMEWMDGIGL